MYILTSVSASPHTEKPETTTSCEVLSCDALYCVKRKNTEIRVVKNSSMCFVETRFFNSIRRFPDHHWYSAMWRSTATRSTSIRVRPSDMATKLENERADLREDGVVLERVAQTEVHAWTGTGIMTVTVSPQTVSEEPSPSSIFSKL